MASDEPVAQTGFDPFGGDVASRLAALASMRREGPVHRMPGGQLLVVSRRGVEQGLASVDSFVGSFGNSGAAAEEDTILAAIAEPRHGRIRKVFNSALAYHHASKVEPFVRELSAERVEEALRRSAREGEVELMSSMARPIPSAVIAHLLGVPAEDFETFARWSDEVLERQGVDQGEGTPLREIHPEFAGYLAEHVRARLDADAPPDDWVTRMLRTEVDGERLGERAVITQTMFLIIAGNETTRNLIGNLLDRLAAEPELFAALRADRSRIDATIEESLRLDSPVQILARTCTADVEIDGVPIAKGERVLFSVASANRDEQSFPDPDRFRIDRPRPRDHVGFGAGPHLCPGAFLARLETRIVLETLLDRVATMELAASHRDDPNPVFWARGPRTLRAVLTPARDAAA